MVHQFTRFYRWAIIGLIIFFVVDGLLLSRVRTREASLLAGNEVPAIA